MFIYLFIYSFIYLVIYTRTGPIYIYIICVYNNYEVKFILESLL